MKIEPFMVEQFLDTYESQAELNLSETSVEPFTLREFLSLAKKEDFFEEIMDTQLTYGYIWGSPNLRRGIAGLYRNARPENILVSGGAIGANFLVFYSLVEPGDTVISIFPTYQQLYSTAKSFGANVKLLTLRADNRWLPDTDELKCLIDERTKLIVINNPHNPSGSLIGMERMKEICSLAEEARVWILCDESYRGLYVDPDDHVPSVIEISDRGIATGSFSKPFSLPGLRLGWIAAKEEIIKTCKTHRDYTTISNGLIDDFLASLAVENVERIMKRNLSIIRTNHKILSDWVDEEPLIEWVPPRAGSTAFLRHHLSLSSEELCLRLLKEKGTLLVPGSCFDFEGFLRIGYGCKTETLRRGLARFSQFLEEQT
jgi:aspartate/methionine/tyrosine aminotransferase